MQRTKTFRGDRLKTMRLDRNWSQSKLARKIQAHVTSISDWERGANEPSGRHVASLCREFGVDAGEFYRNGGDPDDDEDSHQMFADLILSALEKRDARMERRLKEAAQQEFARLMALRDEAQR